MTNLRSLGDARLVTTWSALLGEGCSPGRVRAQLEAGRWQRCGHAIVLHNGPLTERQRWLVARSHAGRSAILTAFTAAHAHGLRGWERPEVVHVLAPRGARLAAGSPVPIRLHRSYRWESVVIHPGTRVHAAADAVLLAAATFATARPACGILAAAVQQRIVSTGRWTEPCTSHQDAGGTTS